MTPLMLDAAVLILAHGAPHPQREASRAVLQAAARQEARIHLSTEAVQEFLFHRMRVAERALAVQEARKLAETAVLHPFDEAILHRSIGLVETSTIRGRGAIHAATALEHGFAEIVTTDSDFAAVPGLIPLTPDQAVARLAG